MKRIWYEGPEGLCEVVPADRARRAGESEDAWLTRVAAKAVPAGADWWVIDDADRPADVRWRDAWELTPGGHLTISLVRARAVRRRELQHAQSQLIRRLSDLIDAALDEGRAAAAAILRQRRHAARSVDLQARVNAVADLAGLANYVPPELAE